MVSAPGPFRRPRPAGSAPARGSVREPFTGSSGRAATGPAHHRNRHGQYPACPARNATPGETHRPEPAPHRLLRLRPGSTTSCAQAAEQRQQITVKDVESADIFDDDSRHAILQAGSRAAHSLPLTNRGHLLGMISSHHEQPWEASARPSSPPWRTPEPS
ncbi:GAF domain-containing protein [Streptomyces sp. CA-251251]|uniref:GAF domain-containing protein n=1 Tax=Streptomyces sp. CA-251251 TaxID=3240063 RepID=UPI003D8F80D2